MSKAVLVMDMPENCRDCNYFGLTCKLMNKKCNYFNEDGRAKDCPLRELPERKNYESMSKVSRDYKNIIKQPNDCRDGCEQMSADGMDVLQEAADIIADYEAMAKHNREMIEKYEKEQPVIKRGMDFYQCPACGKRTSRNHTHCHWCGKKLGWDR